MQLYFKKYGISGEPIVILHGLFGMSDNWHNIARKLSESYTVYTMDLRNHGQSPHAPVINFGVMADDVWETMNDNGIVSAIFIGHSLGGKVAMTFTDKYPAMTDKLVVVDIAPKAYRPGHQIYFDAMKSVNLEVTSRKEIEEQLSKRIVNTGEMLFLLKNLYRNEKGSFGWKFNLDALEKNYPVIIAGVPLQKRVTVPTCFIKGETSNYIAVQDEAEIRESFQKVIINTVPHAGHWVHADNPDDFLTCLLRFIGEA